MYSQILFRKQPGLAALLMVLSASLVLAQGNAPLIQFKGVCDGRASGAVQAGILSTNSSVAGTASYIGRFTITTKDTSDLATNLSTGVVQLVAANGDMINGLSVGRGGGPTDTPNLSRVVFLVTITGGTGRFQGITGVFTLDYLVDNSTIPAYVSSSGTLTGTINTPASAK